MKFPRSKVYTLFGVGSLVLLLGLILSQWPISITVEQTPPSTSPVSLSTEVTTATLITESTGKQPLENNSPTTGVKNPPRALRLSNQTDYPVRIAFLPKHIGERKTQSTDVYGKPAHWDFAPQEGARDGLILSLPKGVVQLEKGDVIIAFAQDGSGRYWGPYVVGETDSPIWDRQKSEWKLVLQP